MLQPADNGVWMRSILLAIGVTLLLFSLVPILATARRPVQTGRAPIILQPVDVRRMQRAKGPKPRPVVRRPLRPPVRRSQLRRRRVLCPPPQVRVPRVPRLLRLAKLDTAGALGAGTIDVPLPPPAPAEEMDEPPQPRQEQPEQPPEPEKVHHVPPVYPFTALERGIEGYVVVRFLVDERGDVTSVKVLECKGHPSFKRAATAAVRKWRFRAIMVEERPVAVWCEQCVHFRLK